MKSISYTLLFCLLFLSSITWAQKMIPAQQQLPPTINASDIKVQSQHRNNIPLASQNIINTQSVQFQTLSALQQRGTKGISLIIRKAPDTGLPYVISGELAATQLRNVSTINDQVNAYLNTVKKTLGIEKPTEEFSVDRQHTDEQGKTHVRVIQSYKGLPIWGSELILHSKNNSPYLLNGRYFPTPELNSVEAQITDNQAISAAMSEVTKYTKYVEIDTRDHHLIQGDQQQAELVIYHIDGDHQREVLAWHITLLPNLIERWELFVDAKSGEVVHQLKNMCQLFHGDLNGVEEHSSCNHGAPEEIESTNADLPLKSNRIAGEEKAFAQDLKGQTREIDVYETSGAYYMIDASRDMHNASLSSFPNNPVGTVWSIDAFNTSPQTSNFRYDHLISGNNSWNDRTAVSAHFNGGLAYEYFRSNFSRNSINGDGGNIVSIINVADEDGSDMDNAFWNGSAMFYGNGDVAFNAPLAKSEDVAGHEMSHGVIQNTANLVYENESGALNESMADVFGTMIDRSDWLIGEDIANPSVFPTGALRDMQNPNNGGNSFGDNGWQPKHMDEFVNLPNTPQGDNGGVHYNSGITNRAYYLFASNPAVGKANAEQVYYKALTDYLVRSSRFIDMRLAVIQAAADRHGAGSAVVQAAEAAFNQVGIGSGGGTNTQQDVGVNPGQDFVLWSDTEQSNINNALTDGTADGTFSGTDHISKPSITDDGSIILFIDADGVMKEIDVDWATGTVLNEFVLEQSIEWRNVATSRDGTKLAAVSGNLANSVFDNRIFVFDFISGNAIWFELYNPTFTQGVSTGDVLFADVLEWDFSGQFIMYDAANRITSNNGAADIEYWDIGFIQVWDNQTNNFADGIVNKLFSGLAENQSVGNPTFSKNSDYIVAFDLIETTPSGTDYTLQGVNIQTGDLDEIFGLNTLGYPSYSKDDDKVIFSFLQNGSQPIIAIRDIDNSKIKGTGDATVFIEDATWGVWFATGERDLTVNTNELSLIESTLSVYPNPFNQSLNLNLKLEDAKAISIEMTDVLGRNIYQQNVQSTIGENTFEIPVRQLTAGTYFISLNIDGEMISRRVVKK